MAIVISVCLATGTAMVLALVLLIRRLGGTGGSVPVTLEWLEDLSIQRYRPMLRLLDARDIEFLRGQPGYTSRMAKNLRAQRCRIFRSYLRCLSVDFARVCTALRVLMVQSRRDRPDLALALIRSRIQFACCVVSLHCQVFLYGWGIGTVDVAGLVKIFDGMRLELRNLVPATMPARA
jgi:hypothetical protein